MFINLTLEQRERLLESDCLFFSRLHKVGLLQLRWYFVDKKTLPMILQSSCTVFNFVYIRVWQFNPNLVIKIILYQNIWPCSPSTRLEPETVCKIELGLNQLKWVVCFNFLNSSLTVSMFLHSDLRRWQKIFLKIILGLSSRLI